MALKDKYRIERRYISKGKSRSGKKNNGVKFIVSHETANNSADADAHQFYFNRNIVSASAHTFIDAGKILEIIPLDEKAWHVWYIRQIDNQLFGDDANDAAIGVELCRTGSFKEAYDRYVWYHAYLCHKFNLNPAKDIVSHKVLDPARRSDPQSWLEPNGITWNQFINDVTEYYNDWHKDSTKVVDRDEKVKSVEVFSYIDFGDKGKHIEDLQEDLLAAGEKLPRYGSDGDFGKETEAAVEAFQARHSLVVDGIVGPKTLGKLKEVLNRKAKANKKRSKAIVPYPGSYLKEGDRGKDVERIQRAVDATPDGIFGPKTEADVRAYQRRHGLAVDGIVGPDTWNMMF
jgi:N-acetylmuramoyl-L-alanine amidase